MSGAAHPVRNRIAFGLILLSFALLYPGLTWPMLTIRAAVTLPFGNTIELLKETRSVLQAVRTLHETGNDFVAGLIFLFSVVVPFVKGLLLLVVLFRPHAPRRHRVFLFIRSISKWAMADVFVTGVFVAYLAAKATSNLDARIEPGFYWFVAYCLVSLLALQVMQVRTEGEAPEP